MVLSMYDIVSRCQGGTPMIYPFHEKQMRQVKGRELPALALAFGTDTSGYDLRLEDNVSVIAYPNNWGHNEGPIAIDPKKFDERFLKRLSADENGRVLMSPHTTALASSVEYVTVPLDVHVLVGVKSTYARCGISLNFTILKPGWEGNVVIEITNTTPVSVILYAGEGIMTLTFLEVNKPPKGKRALGYGDGAGKYQGQKGVTLSKV